MKFGLNDHTISSIQECFSNFPNIKEAIIYGSRAKGNYRKGSDIDITLKGEEITLEQLFKIENPLDELLLPYKIDLSIFAFIENQDLLEHIERVGKEFYLKS